VGDSRKRCIQTFFIVGCDFRERVIYKAGDYTVNANSVSGPGFTQCLGQTNCSRPLHCASLVFQILHARDGLYPPYTAPEIRECRTTVVPYPEQWHRQHSLMCSRALPVEEITQVSTLSGMFDLVIELRCASLARLDVILDMVKSGLAASIWQWGNAPLDNSGLNITGEGTCSPAATRIPCGYMALRVLVNPQAARYPTRERSMNTTDQASRNLYYQAR